MADRYWVAGNGNWNDTAHWSLTDGGAGGASVPTSADDVKLRSLVVVTIPAGYTASCRELRTSAVAGTLTVEATATLNIYGNVFVFAAVTNSGSVITVNAYTFQGFGTYVMKGLVAQSIIGSRFSPPVLVCDGAFVYAGESLTLGAVTVLSGIFTTTGLNCTTLTLLGGDYMAGSFGLMAETLATSGSNVRNLYLGSGTITLTGSTAVNFTSLTNFGINPGTSTISINGSGAAQVINFGGATIHNLNLANASASSFTFTGNVIANRIASARSGAYTVNIDSGKTLTVTEWAVTGTVGNIVSLRCTTPDSQGNITKVGGGTSSTAYVSVKDIHAEPTLTFVSTQSTDDGNNTNWFFDSFYKLNSLLFGSPM